MSSSATLETARSRCRLCGGNARLSFSQHCGFQAPARYDLYECDECETSFAEPLRVDASLYERVYQVAEHLPGYERYLRYREQLLTSPDPLADLCRQEDVYWGVREALGQVAGGRSRPLRLMELGSGFGYLTYALQRAGHACTGVDVSETAVAAARAHFGDYYRVADLVQLGAARERVDVVIATEVIEHLPDPKAFLVQATRLLEPGGALILTTPNRSIYPLRHAWDTDPPPIHLWWFSETSLRRLAWELGLSLSFVDFSSFYGRPRADQPRIATKPQSLDERGQVIFSDTRAKTLARRALRAAPQLFRLLGSAYLTSLWLQRGRERFRKSLSLCAVLRPRASAS
ncbi:MAG TPA: class I SAM-dependent methyltransferase [Polyangiaceae bacterium]|nr:class I SAM-dependent methyltransferase [Polyangiaceae bacterium]